MARVRSRESALGHLLSAAPGAVFALDDQRKIVYCNNPCGELLGVDTNALIGQRCDYRTARASTTSADIAASLCPPPEVFAGAAVESNVDLLHSSGRLLTRCVAYQPLGPDAVHCAGVLAFVSDTAVVDGPVSESTVLHRRLWRLRSDLLDDDGLDELIGVSPAIQRVREQVKLASHGQMRVLIHGPGGSGREHVARLLHRRVSPGPFGQLVPLCCPLLDAELLQSTIMSLVRQSGTLEAEEERSDAVRGHAPTLLLLEVDQLSAEAQGELAGFLSLPDFDLFAIATSEWSLIKLAGEGTYRADLAYALSTLTISLPPLVHRPEDIPLLCQYFVEKFNAQGERQLSGFSPEALDELVGYRWPDNVDELCELVELACRSAEGPTVEVRDLPGQIQWAACADAHPKREDEPIDLDEFLAAIEKELIQRALYRSKGNKTRAAQLLGLNRARFHRRLEHFGIS